MLLLMSSRWLRRHLWLIVVPVAVVGVLGALLTTRDRVPDLTVLCSNKAEACEAVADEFERRQGVDVLVVRMPTSQALAHISSRRSRGEFDLWMGGPAEAYTEAARNDLLRPLSVEPDNAIPAGWKDPKLRWFGVYSGVLSLCVTDDADAPATWQDLTAPRYRRAIAMPNPSTSGTAATFLWSQFERLGSSDAARAYYSAVGANVGTYTNSGTVPAQLVAGGRLPIAVTFDPYCLAEQRAGKPVRPVYLDGVGFEIGSVGVLEGTKRPDVAEAFLAFAISDAGQRVSAAASLQYPTSATLEGNLRTALDGFATPIFGENISQAGQHRAELIALWEKVYFGGEPYLASLPRSAAVGLAAGALAAVSGMAMALGYRFGRLRRLTTVLAVAPFLFPPATWALALTYPPFALDADGTAIVIIANAISMTPIAFAISILALSAVSDRHILEARALGMCWHRIISRFVAPQVARGAAMATAVVGLLVVTDPSLTLVFGGAHQYFASEILTGMQTSRSGTAAAGLVVSIGIAGLVSLPLSRALTARIRRIGVDSLSYRPINVLATGPLALAVPLILLVAIVASHMSGLKPSLAIASTTTILIIVVTTALILAGLIVILPMRSLCVLVYVALVFLLSAQTAGGVLVSALHRDWVGFGRKSVVPHIVGVDSLYQGIFGVALAYLLLALPMAILVMVIIRLRIEPLVTSMRDAGAYRLRIAGELFSVVIPSMTIAVALLTGLVLTRSAPALFIDLGGKLSLVPLTILDHVSSAEDGQAFTLSILTGVLIVALVAAAGVLWVQLRRKLWKSSSLSI